MGLIRRALGPVVRRYEALVRELTTYGDSMAARLDEAESEIAQLRSGRPQTPDPSPPVGSDPA
jgi:hypothetical protein